MRWLPSERNLVKYGTRLCQGSSVVERQYHKLHVESPILSPDTFTTPCARRKTA